MKEKRQVSGVAFNVKGLKTEQCWTMHQRRDGLLVITVNTNSPNVGHDEFRVLKAKADALEVYLASCLLIDAGANEYNWRSPVEIANAFAWPIEDSAKYRDLLRLISTYIPKIGGAE